MSTTKGYCYKFRVNFDEVDYFVRDIEITSTDTFESLHNSIITSSELTPGELAAFAICDQKWNKQKEITLIDMGVDDEKKEETEYDEEDDYSTKLALPQTVMAESVLRDFISDPHQHIIYEYDFLNPQVFYLELLKTSPLPEDTNEADYPRCTYKNGVLPKTIDVTNMTAEEIEALMDKEDVEEEEEEYGYNEDEMSDMGILDEYSDI